MSDYGTGMLTPEQAQRQAQQRSNLNSRLGQQRYQYEMGADQNPGVETKSKSQTKFLINMAFIIILIAGVAGSFISVFDMDKFVSFLEVFAYVWAPLVVSYGSGRAFKNYTDKKYNAASGQSPINISNDKPPQ